MICRLVGWNALGFGRTEDGEHCLINLINFRRGLRCFPTEELAAAVDDTSGVRCIIGRVENPAPFKFVAVTFCQELVVRAAGDYLDIELRNRVVVDDAAERAWREHISVTSVDF